MRKYYYDVLKAIAIIAVVLYHLGLCEFGYLGVDIFLVVAGFFTSKSIDHQIINNKCGYFYFVSNRLFRLYPILLIAGIVCLVFGWFIMLPDDFENVSQSVIATNYFGNNLLSAITTKNYWDISNDYKPLMHTWYVGLIMQFYIVVPFLLFCCDKWISDCDKRRIINIILVLIVGVVSFLGYMFEDNTAAKFYFLPYRLFEFCAGSIVFYIWSDKTSAINKKLWINCLFVMAYLFLICILYLEFDFISRSFKLITTVVLTSVLLVLMPRVEWAQGNLCLNQYMASIGAASFSIFVWHQVVIAFTRYSFTNDLSDIFPLTIVMIITSILAVFFYKYVEHIKRTRFAWVTIFFLLIISTGISFHIYRKAGVVRDVPELEITTENVHKGMWAEYCDRGFLYDRDFPNTGKPKWFVIGNSFGRDMVNIILESAYADRVEVAYSTIESYKSKIRRFAEADVVFLSTLGLNEDLIQDVMSRCPDSAKFFIIGEKNFGESNGQIYRHRFDRDYHHISINMEDGYAKKNSIIKACHSDIFIDMIEMVKSKDGKVRVFTDDGKFISQDCQHLTRSGALFYANIIDWNRFFNKGV